MLLTMLWLLVRALKAVAILMCFQGLRTDLADLGWTQLDGEVMRLATKGLVTVK